MSNNSSRFFHHFIPRSMPCILLPSTVTSSMSSAVTSAMEQSSDHILNLSASMSRHCPSPNPSSKETAKNLETAKIDKIDNNQQSVVPVEKVLKKLKGALKPSVNQSTDEENTDMNSNTVKKDECTDFAKDCVSSHSSTDSDDEDQVMEIEVDDSNSSLESDSLNLEGDLNSRRNKDVERQHCLKPKGLAFGIDQILFKGNDEKGKRSPTSSPELSSSSPPVVSLLSPKSPLSGLKPYLQDHHHSILSKLKLCVTSTSTSALNSGENLIKQSSARDPTLSYFHSYGSYHHQHQMNSIIASSASGTGIHHNNNSHHHQHPLSNCSECVYLRRYCGKSANAPPLSTPFTWSPSNLSIYDSSSIISPGYNQHIPLQPSFGLGTSAHFSTLAINQHNSAGSGTGRRKRSWSRAVFSSLQRKGLEKRFQLQKYITKPDRRQLAASLGLTDAQVKVWFQNRRMKWRHSHSKESGNGESSAPAVSSTTSPTKPGDGALKDK